MKQLLMAFALISLSTFASEFSSNGAFSLGHGKYVDLQIKLNSNDTYYAIVRGFSGSTQERNIFCSSKIQGRIGHASDGAFYFESFGYAKPVKCSSEEDLCLDFRFYYDLGELELSTKKVFIKTIPEGSIINTDAQPCRL